MLRVLLTVVGTFLCRLFMSAPPPAPKTSTAVKRHPMDEEAWQTEFGKHRLRLDKQKTTIPKPSPSAVMGGSLRSPRLTHSPRSTSKSGAPSGRSQPALSLSLDALPAAERRVCEDMVTLLMGKPEEEGKSILQAVFLAAESRRLLANYGGVYPSLGTMNMGSSNSDGSQRRAD